MFKARSVEGDAKYPVRSILTIVVLASAGIASCSSMVHGNHSDAAAEDHDVDVVEAGGFDRCGAPDIWNPGPGGPCDSLGRSQCDSWAREYAGPDAVTVCSPSRPATCIRAVECPVGLSDLSDCRCGSEPRCQGWDFCVYGGDGIARCVSACR